MSETTPHFAETSCSQCGKTFGPGDSGFSHCWHHEAYFRYRRPPGECRYCDEHRNDGMMPPHTASANCESGKHNHCTYDTCY